MSRPPLWRLAPWTRAPVLGLRRPAAVVAVLVTSAVLACAAASAPLFLSSARSAALQQQLAPQCAEAGWGQTGVAVRLLDQNGHPTGAAAPGPAVDDALAEGWSATGTESQPVLVSGTAGVRDARGDELSIPATVFFRPGALDQVRWVERGDGPGVLLPAGYAGSARIDVGDRVTMAGRPVTVAGTYTDLFAYQPSAFWCDHRQLYANDASADTPPPALALATEESVFLDVAAATDGVVLLRQVPVDAATTTVPEAEDLLDRQARAQAAADAAVAGLSAVSLPSHRLAEAIRRAELVESGLRGPVVPVAAAGGLLALVLVAAAGSSWADRRAPEVRLLAARGVGPVPLAGKAALELGLPALAGAALGGAASRLLIHVLGPADDLDPGATTAAVAATVAAFVSGLGAAAAVAGLRARGTAERPLGAPPTWSARVPWELTLLLGAGWCWLLLRSREAVVSERGVAQVDGLLIAFPLLGTAGAAVLLGRLLTGLSPRLRRWAGRRTPAVFLAVNRWTAARPATATLLVAVTLPVAVLGCTATLTASSQRTLDAKVGVQIGATRAVLSLSRFPPTAAVDDVGTFVVRYDGSATAAGGKGDSSGRQDVQVLAVEPDDFAGTAFWDASFADESLPALMRSLTGPDEDGRLPVVATGLPIGDPGLRLGSAAVPAEVVATARVLPGRRLDAPVVLVAADRLPEISRTAGAARTAEIWTNGPLGPAIEALTEAGGQRSRELEPGSVRQTANFLAITWAFGYLSALAAFVGVIAAGGLLLYLEARSRSRVPGYVMARRLGLSRGTHLRSLLVELLVLAVTGLVLGGLLAAGAVALVYRRLDVDRLRPPTPLLQVPAPALAFSAALVLVVAGLAALYAQRAADRAEPATVLRQDA